MVVAKALLRIPSSLQSKLASRTVLSSPVTSSVESKLAEPFKLASRTMSSFPVTASIESKLVEAFEPNHLEVVNESHRHNVPKDSETHFKVIVVSALFNQLKTPLSRHRKVNEVLKDELEGPVHALSIVAKTPAQWETMQQGGVTIPASPNCLGGDGSLPKRDQS